MFKKLVWTKNRMLLDDLVFRVEDDATEEGEQTGAASITPSGSAYAGCPAAPAWPGSWTKSGACGTSKTCPA
jgi:hypothetical protein